LACIDSAATASAGQISAIEIEGDYRPIAFANKCRSRFTDAGFYPLNAEDDGTLAVKHEFGLASA
jgi:hypothetical protein